MRATLYSPARAIDVERAVRLDFDESTRDGDMLRLEYFRTLIVELIHTLFDFCGALLVGIGTVLLCLQLLQFRADPVIFGLKLFWQWAFRAFDAAEFGTRLVTVVGKDLNPFPAFLAERFADLFQPGGDELVQAVQRCR